MKLNEYPASVTGGEPPRMVPTCLKREQRQIVSDEELAAYEHLLATYPDMVSEDYEPYEMVCIEWGEREATIMDDVLDAMQRLEPTETPLLKMMGSVPAENDTVTWGWGIPDTD